MVSATFVADFTKFNDAVQSAQVKLRSFETGTVGVEKALSRMTDSFSGRRVIQEATLAAEAVDRIGGTSKLTESELQRIGRTAQEAVAKMKALGIEVPPGIRKIADETKDVDKSQNSLITTVKSLTAGFAALFTARAAFNFARDVIEDASALKDLSQQTHINVEELQQLAGAMSEFGVDAEELGRGLFQLSKRIAKGDDSVAAALKAMGLELEDVQGLNGEELFLRIEKGLSTLQGSLRDTAASELFGDKLGAAMAGASEGIEGALESAKRFNVVMSDEGQIRWSYLPAIIFGPWSYDGDTTGGTLTAQIVSRDEYRASQRPLVAVVPAGRAQWRWQVNDLQISGATLTARVARL